MVNMNEDFGAYKDSIWKGLTARELGVMAVSAVSCGIIIILLYFILGWNLYISFLIGTAVAAAIIFSQVWKSRSGLSAIEFYRARKYRKSSVFPTTLNSKGQRILSLTRLNMSAAMRQVVMSWKRRI